MTLLSRRRFAASLAAGGAGLLLPGIVARGREADRPAALGTPQAPAPPGSLIRLDSNENPHGPGDAALEAVVAGFGSASRYPDGEAGPEALLQEGLARRHGLRPDNVLLGCGSTELLRMAVHAFAGPGRALVTAGPCFEDPAVMAERIGAPVRAVPVTAALELDLEAMAATAAGAGMVYVCNPNNPTATVLPGARISDFVSRLTRRSTEAAIVIDEASLDYLDDAARETAIPLAARQPGVVVTRTYSKLFGMAGLRVGFAVGEAGTLDRMRRHKLASAVNALGAAAARAVLGDEQHVGRRRALNREAREYTRSGLQAAGCHVGPSATNFIMADVGRNARDFAAACRAHGVLVGRAFPPLTTHARITIGTMEEMRRAMEVFRLVLAKGA